MRGPKGEWRPAGIGALAAHVCKIATGEIEETYDPPNSDNTNVRKRTSAAGKARAKALTPKRRSEISRAAAIARWSKHKEE